MCPPTTAPPPPRAPAPRRRPPSHAVHCHATRRSPPTHPIPRTCPIHPTAPKHPCHAAVEISITNLNTHIPSGQPTGARLRSSRPNRTQGAPCIRRKPAENEPGGKPMTPAGPSGGGGRSGVVIAWVGWWVVSAALYLVLVDTVVLPELVTGAVIGAIGASGATLVRAQRRVVMRPRASSACGAVAPARELPARPLDPHAGAGAARDGSPPEGFTRCRLHAGRTMRAPPRDACSGRPPAHSRRTRSSSAWTRSGGCC